MKWTVFDAATLMLLWKKLDGAEWSWWWLAFPPVLEIVIGALMEMWSKIRKAESKKEV